MNEFLEFLNWSRMMFEENCIERWDNGQKPYSSFEVYYDKHYDWLREKFEERRVLQ
jgi:hypothetical protein